MEPLSGRQQQTMHSDETSRGTTGQRTREGYLGLEPRGCQEGREGAREECWQQGQEAVRNCGARITLSRVTVSDGRRAVHWLTGCFNSAVTVPLT